MDAARAQTHAYADDRYGDLDGPRRIAQRPPHETSEYLRLSDPVELFKEAAEAADFINASVVEAQQLRNEFPFDSPERFRSQKVVV